MSTLRRRDSRYEHVCTVLRSYEKPIFFFSSAKSTKTRTAFGFYQNITVSRYAVNPYPVLPVNLDRRPETCVRVKREIRLPEPKHMESAMTFWSNFFVSLSMVGDHVRLSLRRLARSGGSRRDDDLVYNGNDDRRPSSIAQTTTAIDRRT